MSGTAIENDPVAATSNFLSFATPSRGTVRKIQASTLAVFLVSFVTSLVIGFTIWISMSSPGDHEAKMLASTWSFTLTCFLILLCTPAMMPPRKFGLLVPYAAMANSILFFAFVIIIDWYEHDHDHRKKLLKTAFTFLMISLGLAYFCLIHLCHRAPLLLVMTAELLMTVLLLMCFTYMITDKTVTGAGLAAFYFLGILIVAFSIGIPVYHVCHPSGTLAHQELPNDVEVV